MITKNVKVIFDTNVWISFLIGKRLTSIKGHISNNKLEIIITDKLLTELRIVTCREKLRKYFPQNSVLEFIELLETVGSKVEIEPTHFISRDPKDNFLLDLIDSASADFLLTGDKDLLELEQFKTGKIITPAEFEQQMSMI